MATVIQDSGKQTTGPFATTTLSFATLPVVGRHVAVLISNYDGVGNGIAAVTDNQGNTYTKQAEATDGATCCASLWTCEVVTSSGTFTVTLDPVTSSGNFASWVLVEISGLNLSPVLDKTGTNNSTTGDANATCSAANDAASGIALGVAAVNNAVNDINISDTPPTGSTQIAFEENANIAIGMSSVYKAVTGGTTSFAWTHDNVSQVGWAAVAVTLRDLVAAGGGNIGALMGRAAGRRTAALMQFAR